MDEVIILFDEKGTPIFGADRESNNFLGVGVAYKQNYEDILFKECSELFGLSKSKPVKNDKIKNSRALEIAELISTNNLIINVCSMSLNDSNLQNVINLYADLSNYFRQSQRNVRKRSKSQIIHFHTLLPLLFYLIMSYIKSHQSSTIFSIYIDNWSFPEHDKSTILDMSS